MSAAMGDRRRVDVVVLAAIRLEYAAVLAVYAGAVPDSVWDETIGPSGLPVAFRSFVGNHDRPLRVAVALAPAMGATAATNTLLPLVEQLQPRVIAMCGVCAGRRGKTRLGDVVAAERLYYHDSGKRLPSEVQHDLTTYQLRDDWKTALEGMATRVRARFAGDDWFRRRPITTEWRERRALVALRDRVVEPWALVDPLLDNQDWEAVVATLRQRNLLSADGRELTDAGLLAADNLLFEQMGSLPDLSPTADVEPFQLHVAPIGSGNQVIEDETYWAVVTAAMRKTVALEMEAAALGELAHRQRQHGLDAIVMKGVMDFADHGRDDHFKQFAARASAECLLWFLRENVATGTVAGFDDQLVSGTHPPPSNTPSPSLLLQARYGVVPWYEAGRTGLLADLDAWAADGTQGVSVRLLHADGGAGKTRIAIEWVRRRRDQHDTAGFLIPKPDPRWLERLCAGGAPVLAVIDYAESRPDLAPLLEYVAAYAGSPGGRPRVRLLFLARNDGDWWTELPRHSAAVASLLSGARSVRVPPIAVTATQRTSIFADAALAFAAVRGRPPVLRPPIPLDDVRFDRVLYVHMAALAALEEMPFDAGSLMDVILDHEERFWRTGRAGALARAVEAAIARQLVAASTLRGGLTTQSDAQALFARLLERSRVRDDDELIELLHRVYEGAPDAGYLPALEPDLLGEAMVARVAAPPPGAGRAGGEAWIDRVLVPGDDPHTLTTTFTVLGRASTTAAPALRPWIARLLATELADRALAAIRAAKAVGLRTAFAPLGDLLADALEERGTSSIAVDLDREGIPDRTVSLARVAEWRSRTLLDNAAVTDDETAMLTRARRLNQHAADLVSVGHRRAAVAPAKEQVAIYRVLARRDPVLQIELAGSLNNLATALIETGEREDAYEAAREAVSVFRVLAAADAATFRPLLAMAIDNLGLALGGLARREEALAIAREAVELYRELAKQTPSRFEPGLAAALDSLGTRLADAGLPEAAIGPTSEAVEVYKRLATTNPDAFQPFIATSLNNLANRLSALGRKTEALQAMRDTVAVRRQLDAHNPERFRPYLAGSLHNLGNILQRNGEIRDALASAREATTIYRDLAGNAPSTYEAELGGALNSLAVMHWLSKDVAAALAAAHEATTLLRAARRRHPDAFLSDLAMATNTYGTMLAQNGDPHAALEILHESLTLRRAQWRQSPQRIQAHLASSLNNLADVLGVLGRYEEALAAALESLDLIWPLFEQLPSAHAHNTRSILFCVRQAHDTLRRQPPTSLAKREAHFARVVP